MAELLYREESYRILGACFSVFKDKGHCMTEPIYHECLEIEFAHLGIPFLSKPPFTLTYRGQVLQHTFEPDFWCFDKIIVEIKAVRNLLDEHRAQVINYVHTVGCDLGLLINFGSYPKVQHERFLHTRNLPSPPDSSDLAFS